MRRVRQTIRGVCIAGCLFSFQTVAAQPPRPASVVSAAQARYDAAQAAFDRAEWPAAVEGFSTLLPADRQARLSKSQAMIASRLAYSLLRIGRATEARSIAERAWPALTAGSEEIDDDGLTIAEAALNTYDYQAAANAAQQVRDDAVRRGSVTVATRARVELASALVTLDPSSAAAELDAVLTAPDVLHQLDATQIATVQDLRARAALNSGDLVSAGKWSDRAIATSGGLTLSKVSGAQVTMRVDAAIVSSLRKDDEQTRKYLTYTGAGHLKSPDWVGEFDGDLPVCGDSGIEPEDVVVVELAIDPDGAVKAVSPLYVSRPGKLGEAFARAASTWRWQPDQISKVDPFWRSTLSLQLSCQSRPRPDTLDSDTVSAVRLWLASRGVETSQQEFRGYVAPNDARLARDDLSAVPALFGRMSVRAEGVKAAARINAILDANSAPASAFALLRWRESLLSQAAAHGFREAGRRRAESLSQAIPRLELRFGEDPSLVWLKLEEALAWEDAGEFSRAAPVLAKVMATPPKLLPTDSTLRSVALLHSALVSRMAGDRAGEEAKLAASGVNPQQCLLFDTHPVPTSKSVNSSMFPPEAQRWHFEGYVREAFDITDDGHVAHPRPIVAYPPLVFAKSTEDAVRGFRYVPPRIGSTAVGCTGEIQSVRYRLP